MPNKQTIELLLNFIVTGAKDLNAVQSRLAEIKQTLLTVPEGSKLAPNFAAVAVEANKAADGVKAIALNAAQLKQVEVDLKFQRAIDGARALVKGLRETDDIVKEFASSTANTNEKLVKAENALANLVGVEKVNKLKAIEAAVKATASGFEAMAAKAEAAAKEQKKLDDKELKEVAATLLRLTGISEAFTTQQKKANAALAAAEVKSAAANLASLGAASEKAAKSTIAVEASLLSLTGASEKARQAQADLAAKGLAKVEAEALKTEKQTQAYGLELRTLKEKSDAAAVSLRAFAEAAARSDALKASALAIKEFTSGLGPMSERIAKVQAQLASLGQAKIAPLVDASNIVALEGRLNAISKEAANTSKQVSSIGLSASGAGGGVKDLSRETATLSGAFGDATREGLFLRRVITGLGFSFLAAEVLNTLTAFDKLRAQFAAVFEGKAEERLDFIKKAADNLGVSVTALGSEFAKFSAAVKGSALEGEQADKIFLQIAASGAKLALSQEDIAGALKAVTQIVSKGKVSLEELSGQLGDRLPGALKIASEAAGVTTAKFLALVEAGKVDSNTFLVGFAEGFARNLGVTANTRIETLGASIQRVKNAFAEFTDKVVGGQLGSTIQTISNNLAALVKSKEFEEFFTKGAKALADFAKFVIENSAAIKTLVATLITLKAFTSATDIISSLSNTAARGVGSLTAFSDSLGPLNKSMVGAASSAKLAADGVTRLLPALTNAQGAAKFASPNFNDLADSLKRGVVSTGVAVNGYQSIAPALVKAGAATAPFKAGMDSVGVATAAAGAQAVSTGSKFASFVGVLGTVGAALLIAKAAYDLLSLAADAIVNRLLKGKEAAVEQTFALGDLKVAQNAIAKNGDILSGLQAQGVIATQTSISIGELTAAELLLANSRFKQGAEASLKLTNGFEAEAKSLEKLIKITEESSLGIVEKARATGELTTKLKANNEQLLKAREQAVEYAASFALIKRRVQDLLPDLEKASNTTLEGLNQSGKNIVATFEKAKSAGEELGVALRKAIPPDFATNGVRGITDTINAFTALRESGTVTAGVIKDELIGALDKLSGQQLQVFETNSRLAFESGQISAKALALALEATAGAALKNLGVDAELSGKKISRSFIDATESLKALVETGKATAPQLQEALAKAVNQAANIQELDNLKLRFQGLLDNVPPSDAVLRFQDKVRLLGASVDSALGDSFGRLGIQSQGVLKGISDQAAVDFDRVSKAGTSSFETLQAGFAKVAEAYAALNGGKLSIELQVKAIGFEAFQLLVDTAKTTSEKVSESFDAALSAVKYVGQLKIMEEAIVRTFASGRISAEAFSRSLADVVVKGFNLIAESSVTTGERIKSGFLNAISAVSNSEGLKALESAFGKTFDRGLIKAKEFAEGMDALATKAFELASKVEAGFAGATSRLGVQTRDQLRVIAEQAEKDFAQLADAGVLNADQLRVAFEKYAQAAIASNNGVADSFLSAQANGLGFGDVLTGLIRKADNLGKSLSATKDFSSSSTFSPKDFSTDELERRLADTSQVKTRSGLRIDETIYSEAILAELRTRSAKINEDYQKNEASRLDLLNAQKTSLTTQSNAALDYYRTAKEAIPPKEVVSNSGSFSGSLSVTNNFNSSGLTPESIRTEIAAQLAKYRLRTA